MKTIVFYVLGIPCILAGSRFAGLDKALIHNASDRPVAVVNEPVARDAETKPTAPSLAESTAIISSDSSDAAPGAEQQLVAVVVPEACVSVDATASGIVSDLLVRPGDVVEKGESLATLDTREIEAEIRKQQQQTLALASKAREAEARYAKFKMKLAKRAPLVQTRAVTAEEYHDLQAELQMAAEQIKQFQAEVRSSREEEKRLQRTRDRYVISAPLSGKVKRVALHVGQYLEKGEVILDMESSRKQVRALMPTDLLARIHGLTFQFEAASGDRVELGSAAILEATTTNGFHEVIFDLENAQQFVSNQPLNVYVQAGTDAGTPRTEGAATLAVR